MKKRTRLVTRYLIPIDLLSSIMNAEKLVRKLNNKTKAELVWVVAVLAILVWAAVSNAAYLHDNSSSIANPVGGNEK